MNSAEYIECSEARLSDIDHKWKVLFNQKTRAPIYNVDQYVDTLREYTNDKSGNTLLTITNGTTQNTDIHPVSYFLRKLKLDLKMSYRSFLDDFTQPPNDGLERLIKLLKLIQKTARDMSSLQGRSKIQNAKKLLNDEHDCLLCIRFCLRIQRAVNNLLDESYGLESVASALMSSNVKSRITAIEIMILVLTEKEGFSRNLDCFTYFRLKNGEPIRFKFLVGMLMSNPNQNTKFQICCMKYINSLLAAAPDSNTQVFLQNELESAGLDIESLFVGLGERTDANIEDLGHELLMYRKTRVDIDLVLQSNTALENYASNLQLKIIELKEEIKKLQAQHKSTRSEVKITSPKQIKRIQPSTEQLRSIAGGYKPNTVASSRQKRSTTKLPMLKWRPLIDVKDTVFEELDYKLVLDEIDLSLLEQKFGVLPQVQSSKPALFKKPKRNENDDKITFLDPSRAKSLLILQKRIGQSPVVIKQMVQTFAMDMLHADDAELLLKFIPSEQEMKNLSSLDCRYEELGEAEQLLTQLMSVDRIEEKLKLIIFMKQFPEKVANLKPQIKEIYQSSVCLINNTKIRKVLEIILAIGNFMNSDKQQCACGFRVDLLRQLQDIRSPDKSFSLIDYLVQVILDHYPQVHEWYKELKVEITYKGSYQTLVKEVDELQDGMQLLEDEIRFCSCQQLNKFRSHAEEDVLQLMKDFQNMEKLFLKVCSMFGETHLAVEPYEFFGHFYKFAELYKMSYAKIPTDTPQTSHNFLSELEMHLFSRKTQQKLNLVSARDDSSMISDMYIESGRFDQDGQCSDSESCKDEDICSYDPYGILIDHSKHVITESEMNENWIISQKPEYEILTKSGDIAKQLPLVNKSENTEEQTRKSKYVHKNSLRKRTIESGIFCESDEDSENGSCDSAFVGSVTRHNSGKGESNLIDNFLGEPVSRRTSTPNILEPKLPATEPEPDYPNGETPNGSVRSYSSEVSRILREFEGSLNGYDGEVEVIHNSRRFYTIKSIIYL